MTDAAHEVAQSEEDGLDAARQLLADAEQSAIAECSQAILAALKKHNLVLVPEVTLGPLGVVRSQVRLVPSTQPR